MNRYRVARAAGARVEVVEAACLERVHVAAPCLEVAYRGVVRITHPQWRRAPLRSRGMPAYSTSTRRRPYTYHPHGRY